MTYVVRKDGTIYDLDSLGFRTKGFVIESLSSRHITEDISGRDGLIDLGTTYEPRKIMCSFKLFAKSFSDFPEMRDQVFRIFKSKEPFYLIDKRQMGKRWEVKCSSSFTPEQIGSTGIFDIEFVSFKVYAESDLKVYNFTSSQFNVMNYGDIKIDPRLHHLKITFKGISDELTIENTTTGDEWIYDGTTTESDEVVLEGIRSTKSGLSIFRNTNKNIITLDTGLNEFIILGASKITSVKLEFFYLYV